MVKTMLYLGGKPGQTREQFEEEYLGTHAKKIAASDAVKKYLANIMRDPTPEMLDAGWGSGGNTGIWGLDEVWTEEGTDVLAMYEDAHVIGAYEIEQIDLRTCLDHNLPLGTKSPWIKRIGLIRRQDGMRLKDFYCYWEKMHGPLALQTHIGACRYEQNRFIKVLKEAEEPWDASMTLYYFNIDAFRYAHFSKPGSQKVIADDVANFCGKFLPLPYGEEYVMKR